MTINLQVSVLKLEPFILSHPELLLAQGTL